MKVCRFHFEQFGGAEGQREGEGEGEFKCLSVLDVGDYYGRLDNVSGGLEESY